jgi:putative transposase
MPEYRRAYVPGGTFFFTLVTENRAPLFRDAGNRALLHAAIAACRVARPFVLVAIVLLPDHLHFVLTLPDEDADFSTRIASIKAQFTRSYLDEGGFEQVRSDSRISRRNRGVWQRRFWEHAIRDESDLNHHLDYIHYNPFKHGLASCPHAWSASSFGRFVSLNMYEHDWLCSCDGRHPAIPDFTALAGRRDGLMLR